MLQSTHYELKLVEGSDIVNPLVIDRPNYETIDGVMYENESKSIGNATELKSGTIHALTRTKGNQRFFCFTATSNYEAGDTFTVDSIPVTALLPNGTALPDNAYVVNGTVMCSLIGTLLTVYTLGSAVADDSIRLGGELPEYYATASALANVKTTADAASTLSLNNAGDIAEIKDDLDWKYVGQFTSTAYAIAIPNDAREVCFDVIYQSINLHSIVPVSILHSGLVNWFNGSGCEVGTVRNMYGAGIQSFTYNGTDCFANGGTVDMYYR